VSEPAVVDVQFGGKEGALTLSFCADETLPVGVRCERIELTLGPLKADVSTVLGLDVKRVHNELSAALTTSDISGGSRFESVHHDFRVRIELQHGKGSIVAKAVTGFGDRDGYAEISLTTDQSFLHATVQQLATLLRRYPQLLGPS
jgi:hypothetical protein